MLTSQEDFGADVDQTPESRPAFTDSPRSCGNVRQSRSWLSSRRRDQSYLGGVPRSAGTLETVFFLKASEDSNLNTNGLALSHVRAVNEMNAMRFGSSGRTRTYNPAER